jgi:hypothetical protein
MLSLEEATRLSNEWNLVLTFLLLSPQPLQEPSSRRPGNGSRGTAKLVTHIHHLSISRSLTHHLSISCTHSPSISQHRIGQKRPVRVMRFLMKDSIEERMVALQDAKAALGKGALEKLRPEEKRKARLTALKDLFEVEDEEQLWH